MRISDSLVLELLKKSGKVNEEQLKGLLEQQKTERKPLQDVAVRSNFLSEKDLTQLYAQRIDVPFIEINPKSLGKDVLKLIPERIARQYNAVVFEVSQAGGRKLAMEDPDDVQAINFLQKQLGTDIKIYITTKSNILAALDQYRENIGSELTEAVAVSEGTTEAEEKVGEADIAEDSPVAKTVSLIIEYAIKQNASDIHIEPREDHISIRYRIDGQLKETNKLPRKILASLVSRIKILSSLKIDERRASQDGRFKVKLGSGQYALRVSTLPIADGEKVVMRILDESSAPSSLQALGFWGSSLESLEKALIRPHGMIIFSGPTGSGKSTILFSILSRLNRPSVNISTIEDPVEYRIPGVNQVQVNPAAGMTFATGLRALLRQDPNIIMVGEIRDAETARLAIQAALTGHLVFSTLHTNNASTSLPRLLDMGVEPFLISSTVRAVVGQRLVRRLSVDSTERYKPDDATIKRIMAAFGISNPEQMKRLHELEMRALVDGINPPQSSPGEKGAADASTSETGIQQLWRLGKSDASGAFKGRVGIYEVLSISSEIEKMIVSNSSSELIQNQAVKEGMVSMQMDGLIKALRGQTTLEEVMRVTSER